MAEAKRDRNGSGLVRALAQVLLVALIAFGLAACGSSRVVKRSGGSSAPVSWTLLSRVWVAAAMLRSLISEVFMGRAFR